MDLGRPDTEAAGDVERDEYEINMFYLFRLFNHKRFHKLIPGDLDEKTQLSLNRLIHFNEHLPGAGAKRQRARTRFRVGKEEYLTALAKYWRNLPDKEEMMKFQDIWEHVAQRPLACEGLMEAEPSPNDERHRWTTLNTSRDRPLAKRLRICQVSSNFDGKAISTLYTFGPITAPLKELSTYLYITMASRVLPTALRAFARPAPQPMRLARTFRTSSQQLETPSAAIPLRKPVGAFRGGMFGFLLGTTLAGAGTYYYILDEYRVSNELLTEDIYALQAAVQRIHNYVNTLEEKIDALQKKK
ncbi:MAG: hypothetical protein LQ346_001034 [Caloplaca aetnensis]|nr:MAG: hypothetical protein LQ346_001034 [Caloplaca aetnensis]